MHSLIIGVTGCGKTTLAKRMAGGFIEKESGVIVLDPMNDGDFPASFKTDDEAKFYEAYFKSKNCHVFIDEASRYATRGNEMMLRVATQGRHWGHRNYFIAQRAQMMTPNIRTQCTEAYIFSSSHGDAKIMYDDWRLDDSFKENRYAKITNLPKGECYRVKAFADKGEERITKMKIF